MKSARNLGIDLADLRKMALEAGDGTPFLVIQAIGKKSILRLTSISLLKKRRGKSAQAHSLELLFTNPPIFHRSRVMRGRSKCEFGNAPRDLRDVSSRTASRL